MSRFLTDAKLMEKRARECAEQRRTDESLIYPMLERFNRKLLEEIWNEDYALVRELMNPSVIDLEPYNGYGFKLRWEYWNSLSSMADRVSSFFTLRFNSDGTLTLIQPSTWREYPNNHRMDATDLAESIEEECGFYVELKRTVQVERMKTEIVPTRHPQRELQTTY